MRVILALLSLRWFLVSNPVNFWTITERDYDSQELPHEMLLMAEMSNSQINRLLTAINKAGIPRINHKAALTETNQYWNTLQLYEEINKEYEYFRDNA